MICLVIFGADSFLIPTMIVITLLLTGLRKSIEGPAVAVADLADGTKGGEV